MTSKNMSIISNPVYNKVVKVEFPFNESILDRIRKERSKLNYVSWDPEQKSWIFSLDESSLCFLNRLAHDEEFIVDDEFASYQTQITDIQNNIENCLPIVSFDGAVVKFLNASPNITQPTTANIIESLFYARAAGIATWDDSIEETEEWIAAPLVVKQFLESSPAEPFAIHLEKTPIIELSDIVNYQSPALFVIPGGTELEKMELILNFLKSVGIANHEVSVLFRLPKEHGEKFNSFIRTNGLNSPVTDTTKIVIISSKVPKTLIEKKIKFNCIINFNFYSIHYSIRNLISWHHNVVSVIENTQQKAFYFGNM